MTLTTSTTEMPTIIAQNTFLSQTTSLITESNESIFNKIAIDEFPTFEEDSYNSDGDAMMTTTEDPTTIESMAIDSDVSSLSTSASSSFLQIDATTEKSDLDTPQKTQSTCCASVNCNGDYQKYCINSFTESIQNMIKKDCSHNNEKFDMLLNQVKLTQQKLDDMDLKIQSVNDQLANVYEVMRVYILPPSSLEYLDKLLVDRKLRVK